MAKYGKDNADYLMEVMGALAAALQARGVIDMGIGDIAATAGAKAEAMPSRRGWVVDRVAGDVVLMRRLLEGDWERRFPDPATGRAARDDVR